MRTHFRPYIEEISKHVDITVHYNLVDDSFDHAFGTRKIEPYYQFDHTSFDGHDLTSIECMEVEAWISANQDEIEDQIPEFSI